MKKLIILLTCLSLTGFVLAEDYEGKYCDEKKGKKPDFSKVLELTDDQKSQFEALSSKHREEHKALRENMRAQMEELHTKHQQEMKTVLTEDQYKKYDEMMEKHRKHKREGKRGDKFDSGDDDKREKE